MTWHIRITNGYEIATPGTGATSNIRPPKLTIKNDLDRGMASLTFLLDFSFSLYLQESNVHNPAMLGSRIELIEDLGLISEKCWYKGNLVSNPAQVTNGGEQSILVDALDRKWRLTDAVAPIGGLYSWTWMSPVVQLVQHLLIRSVGNSTTTEHIYFPEPYPSGGPLSPAWYIAPITDNITVNQTAGDTILNVGAVEMAFPQRGFIQAGTEIFFYDGYFFNGVKWQFHSCSRGDLGTVAIPLPIGTPCWLLVPKSMAPFAEYIEELTDSHNWLQIPRTKYGRHFDNGSWEFSALWPWDLRATYRIYDETDPAVLLLSQVFETMVKVTLADGGPGFTAGTLDITHLDHAINLFRYDLRDNEGGVLRIMNSLLKNLSLDNNVLISYDPESDKLKYKAIQQKVTPDFIITDAEIAQRDSAIEEVYKEVLIIHTVEKTFNSLHESNGWHRQPWTKKYNGGGLYDWHGYPDIWTNDENDPADPYVKLRLENWVYGINDEDRFITFFNNFNLDEMVDDSDDSTCSALWNALRVSNDQIPLPWVHSYFHFGKDYALVNHCKVVTLDLVSITIDDNRRGSAFITIEGTINGDPDDPEATTGPDGNPVIWDAISMELDNVGGDAGDTDTRMKFESKQFTIKNVNMLRIVWNKIPTDRSENSKAGVRQFFVRAFEKKVKRIVLTGNPALQYNPLFVYIPETAAKLCDIQKVTKIDIGTASDNEAILFGRSELIRRLTYWMTDFYAYDAGWPPPASPGVGIPQIGMTGEVRDSTGATIIKGLLRELQEELSEGEGMKFKFGLIDMTKGFLK